MLNWFKKEEKNVKDVTNNDLPNVKVDENLTEDNKVRGASTDLLMVNNEVQETAVSVMDATVVDNNSPEIVQAEKNQVPSLTYKEAKALKRSRYGEIEKNPRFKNSYVLLNKRTNQIVEIKAASSFHACNIIGWKANRVQVLATNTLKEEMSTINK